MSGLVRIQTEDRVRRVTLARAEKRNALNEALCQELLAALHQAELDPAVNVILLDAEGPVFCAGMDLEDATASNAAERTAVHEKLFTVGARLRKPLIAAVQGNTFGGGLGLVANAHIALAADSAQFGLTEIRLAMWPFVIYPAIVSAVGERRALELSLSGRVFSAADAERWGLVHQLVPADQLASRARETAQTLAHYSADAVHRSMTFVQGIRGHQLEDAIRDALDFRAEAFASEEFAEGVRAFREKRAPLWSSTGRNS